MIRKARKDYTCDYCGMPIAKGTQYDFQKGKEPTYDVNDKQIGIKYWSAKLCYPGKCIEPQWAIDRRNEEPSYCDF